MSRLALYDAVSVRAAGVVVGGYSTSFGLATRLLTEPTRSHVRVVYALVRLADEVVDGAADEAGGGAGPLLDALEADTAAALRSGFSTNVLVHAFAGTARAAGFGDDLVRPFFASMRRDLDPAPHDEASLATYVHGSAEVVGLMCLRVFLLELPRADREATYRRLTPGARALGAAFQKINFLRDLGDDSERLGRAYFPGVGPELTEARKAEILADVEGDLRLARQALPHLPGASRRAVAVAAALFTELARRLARTPAAELGRTRVSVPAPVKARVVAGVLAGAGGA